MSPFFTPKASVTLLAAISPIVHASPWHMGAVVGDPFDIDNFCCDIAQVGPDMLGNWGQAADGKSAIQICNGNVGYIPMLWGNAADDTILSKDDASVKPFAIALENEPNWWGFVPLTASHGSGANMTAQEAASRWPQHKKIITAKWGSGIQIHSPSPVNGLYNNCTNGNGYECAWQPQLDWLDAYFAACNCYDDIYAIDVHEYSCHLDQTQQRVKAVQAHFPGKPIFFGELGCDGPSAATQGAYLTSVVEWASDSSSGVVGLQWAGLNSVGSANAQLVQDGTLTAVGQAFVAAKAKYPSRAS